MADVLTGIYATDLVRPTFFELFAQEKLREGLYPAVRFLVQTLAPRFPRGLPIWTRWEYVYTAILLLVEQHHLRTYAATFTEHFYSLQRELYREKPLSAIELVELRRKHGNLRPILSKGTVVKVILLMVIRPLLANKLEQMYRATMAQHRLGETPLTPGQALLLSWYPKIRCVSGLTTWAYAFAYLTGQSNYWSPYDHMLGLTVTRQPMELPSEQLSIEEHAALANVSSSMLVNGATFIKDAGTTVFKTALWSGVYGIQFLQWWYTRESDLQPYERKPAPPPPTKEQIRWPDTARGPRAWLPQDLRVCPLCQARPHRNPTAAPSGYVFCFSCIRNYVLDHGHCPVSGKEAHVDLLRRIFDSSNGG